MRDAKYGTTTGEAAVNVPSKVDDYHLKKRHRRPDPDLPRNAPQPPLAGIRWSPHPIE
jgi:hypothetical protein